MVRIIDNKIDIGYRIQESGDRMIRRISAYQRIRIEYRTINSCLDVFVAMTLFEKT